MRTYHTLITFDQYEGITRGGLPLAGGTFPVVSVFHDQEFGTVEVKFLTCLGERSAWLDLTRITWGRREVVRDYQGMRGALMDRVAAGEPLEAFMDLLVSATGVAAILRRQHMPSLAAKLDDTVGLVLGAAPQQKITCSECGRVVTITGGGFEWGHFSDCPMVSCADEDIDLDLSAMDDFTIYDDSPSERP